MAFKDLRDFIDLLEKEGELKRIKVEVSSHLEVTEISDRTLKKGEIGRAACRERV